MTAPKQATLTVHVPKRRPRPYVFTIKDDIVAALTPTRTGHDLIDDTLALLALHFGPGECTVDYTVGMEDGNIERQTHRYCTYAVTNKPSDVPPLPRIVHAERGPSDPPPAPPSSPRVA